MDVGILGSAVCSWVMILILLLSRAIADKDEKPEAVVSDVDRWRRMRRTSRRQ
jgi:hypothetical protein